MNLSMESIHYQQGATHQQNSNHLPSNGSHQLHVAFPRSGNPNTYSNLCAPVSEQHSQYMIKIEQSEMNHRQQQASSGSNRTLSLNQGGNSTNTQGDDALAMHTSYSNRQSSHTTDTSHRLPGVTHNDGVATQESFSSNNSVLNTAEDEASSDYSDDEHSMHAHVSQNH